MENKEKKPRFTVKQQLDVIIRKIKLMDEHSVRLETSIDELEDRIMGLEDRIFDEREVHFKSDFGGLLDDPDDDGENE